MVIQVTTKFFRRGMAWVIKSIFYGDLCVAQLEEGMVEIVQNLVDFALEGYFTDELLRHDVGIVVGFVLSHPEVFKTSSGGN